MSKLILIFSVLCLNVYAQTPPAPAANPVLKISGPTGKAEKAPTTNATSPDATLAVGYTKEYMPTVYKADDCLIKNKIEICQKLLEQKKTEGKPGDGFQYAKKLCEIKVDFCNGLFKSAQTLGHDTVLSVQKFLEDGCTKNADTCNELALLQESNKQYSAAINFARKYYLKYQKGDFLRLSYAYGDKNEAFAVALAECTRNNSTCSDFMKTMADNPQLNKFIDHAEKYCASGKGENVEATCARVGAYYDVRKRYDKSAENWESSCKRTGALSCVLMIGSTGVPAASQLRAYKQFCLIDAEMSASLSNVKRMNCKAGSQDVPGQLKAFSIYELKKATDEFKAAK